MEEKRQVETPGKRKGELQKVSEQCGLETDWKSQEKQDRELSVTIKLELESG